MTHAEQEQLVLTYLQQYRHTINIAKFATAAGINDQTLRFFVQEQRGLAPEALAKVWAYLKQQAQALQVFSL